VTPLRATYRLQLSPELDFHAARQLVGYLRDLGISHLYLSPALQARAGSTHGYDVVDPGRISEELGGEAAFRDLAGQGLGVVLDIVPNHMGRDEANRFWADPELRERFFDVDHATDPPTHRRFFDIDDLAAIRVERDEVFDATHAKVLALLAEGVLDGLRVDHPDGLADPAGYLRRLRERGAEHVWVEKILAPGEPLRTWPVTGTVGYEFLNEVAGLWVDPAGEGPMTALWIRWSGDARSFDEVALEAQLEQARGPFDREVQRLRRVHPRFDPGTLADALARLPVYRTYVEPWSGTVADEDRRVLADAGMDRDLAATLLLEQDAPDEFVTRFQQTSPAVTAKGIEDTSFYRYARLLTLCEVGNDPGRFGVSVADFHASNAERAERFPLGLLTTQTHDAKRSADVRARIGVLSTMPEAWGAAVERWHAMTGGLPDGAEEWFVYQTLVGAFPIEESRLRAYLRKALREAKRTSSWLEPDEAHEREVQDFAAGLLADDAFLQDFRAFCAPVWAEGARVALGYVLLKLTSPGVPDVYQGDDMDDLSLVDPDNRRPVDFATRRRALAELASGAPPVPETRKLDLIRRGLDLRARRPEAFAGAYRPLEAGPGVVAFARGDDVLVAAGLRDWHDAGIAVPEDLRGAWFDVLTGSPVQLGAVATPRGIGGELGLALLERADAVPSP
jgi:(1->4)-alpha-D-glucan 1-alpha-D-glucosylmutase